MPLKHGDQPQQLSAVTELGYILYVSTFSCHYLNPAHFPPTSLPTIMGGVKKYKIKQKQRAREARTMLLCCNQTTCGRECGGPEERHHGLIPSLFLFRQQPTTSFVPKIEGYLLLLSESNS